MSTRTPSSWCAGWTTAPRHQPRSFAPAKFLAWVKTQLPLSDAVHSCYQAGPFGYGLHRDLVAPGMHNVVVQPVCLDEHHKGVNHDKSDAKELAPRLDRYAAGHTHALATVRVPTPEEEQKRIKSHSSAKSSAWPPRAGACC